MTDRNRMKKVSTMKNIKKEETKENITRKLVETETGEDHELMKKKEYKKEKKALKYLNVPEVETDNDQEAKEKRNSKR